MDESNTWNWVKTVTLALITALTVRYFLFAPILVDGQSMLPALDHKDRMIVNKIGYFISEPERFDIVVFEAEENINYIKRIIGLPGDSISYRNDILYINNEPVPEEFLEKSTTGAAFRPSTEDFEMEELLPFYKVPEEHLFVLGDNREHSNDSRHIGLVPYDKVLGEAEIIIWPVNKVKFVD